jgi:hypothetical protein
MYRLETYVMGDEVPHTRLSYPSTSQLLARARQQARLSDFGRPSFVAGLNRFLQSLEEDANLTEEGQALVLEAAVRQLCARLEIEKWYQDHPETAELPLAGPIFVTGLPRTGTTALCAMMSLDPQLRCLRMWEQMAPCPPPILELEKHDPRRLNYIRTIDDMFRAQPEQKAMHLWEIDGTVEDTQVLGMEGMDPQLPIPAFGYQRWWWTADMRAAYAYHRRVMLVLQSKRPPNLWFLKAPHYIFHLEDIVTAYPNARFVFMHRDPAKIVPSCASLVSSLLPPGSRERMDLRNFGAFTCEYWRMGIERAMAAQSRLGEHHFFDIHHQDFNRDPFGALDRIYAFLGLEVRPQVLEAMSQWHAKNRSGAHGIHRYRPEDFGLSAHQIRSEFEFYIRHFNVASEPH